MQLGMIAGHQQLAAKVQQYRPRVLAVLGISAYRTAFNRPKAVIGKQEESIHETLIWVLPNPSGLNAHYQLKDLKRVYRELQLYLVQRDENNPPVQKG